MQEEEVMDEGYLKHFLFPRSPRSQDYVRLRKLIADNDKALLHELIWSNPRYLIGGGDNPTILHEGCRLAQFSMESIH